MVAAATLAVFYPVAGHKFLNYDDPPNITTNSYYRPLTWRNVRQLWLRPYSGVYVPVTSMFWAAEVAISQTLTPVADANPQTTASAFDETAGTKTPGTANDAVPVDGGLADATRVNEHDSADKKGDQSPADPPPDPNSLLDPRVFHLGNLLLHLLSALGVLALLRHVTGSEWGALAGALLFAVHPLQVETVSWITETKGLLCAAFAWVAILEYLRFVEASRDARSRRRSTTHLAVATISFLLSLLSKPMAVSVPLMAAVIAVGWYRPQWRELVPLAVWLLLAVGLAALTKMQQRSESFEYVAPWSMRPFIAGDTLAFYLGKLLWPVELATDYGRSPRWLVEHPTVLYSTWLAPAAVIVVLLAVRRLRTERALWVAVGLVLVALAPLLGLVPFGFQDNSTVADRYFYLAMIGPALVVAWAVDRLAALGDRWREATMATVAVLILVLGVLAHRQCLTWRDSEQVALAGLAVNPDSPLLHQILAVELGRRGQHDAALAEYERAAAHDRLARGQLLLGMAYARRDDLDKAMECFRRGRELQPGAAASCEHMLGEAHRQRGEYEEALRHYQAARQLSPDSPSIRISLAMALGHANRWAEAIPEIRAALRIQTEDAGNWTTLAQALERTGDHAAAIEAYREALRLTPDKAAPHVNLGTALWQARRVDEALAAYARALEFEPDNLDALRNSGLALISQNRLDEAARFFERLLASHENDADAMYNLAEVRNRQGRGDEAYALYNQAVAQKPELADAHAALASLCDRLGRATEAIEHYNLALQLQPDSAVLHNNLGVLLFKSGEVSQAAEHLAHAVEIDPGYTEARENLDVVRRAQEKR
ncbi:MAG: tetratricopeptide repeat protein [Pirellulales bacterium]